MKMRLPCIGFLLALAMLVACGRRENEAPVAVRQSMSLRQLATIDSLMWWQPDNALQVLLDFADSPAADSLSGFEEPYCQLLVAELLYKNDYAQSNREELLQAVAYFDSVQHHSGNACGFSTDDMAFLDARAHYINGVGYYENDSLVPACQEYLKALEVMEETFAEKDLVGHKARFMALIYNRLGEMFLDQFTIESSIACLKQALKYCQIEPTSPIGIAKILDRFGMLYDMMNNQDSARIFFAQAIDALPNTENLVYRDIMSCKALCDYQIDSIPQPSLEILRQMLCQADDESERLIRCLTISAIFFEEKMYDSVVLYLEPVYMSSEDEYSQIIAAEHLCVVYDSLGNNNKSVECMRFLAEHKKYEGESKALASRLDNLFHDYQIQKQAKWAEVEQKKAIKKVRKIIVPVIFVLALTIVVVKFRGRKMQMVQQTAADRMLEEKENIHKHEMKRLQAESNWQLEEAERNHQQNVDILTKRHEEELRAQKDGLAIAMVDITKRHEAEHLAFRKEQDALRQDLQQREERVKALEKALNRQREAVMQQREDFLNEIICQSIFNLLQGKHITTRDYYSEHGIALSEVHYKQLKEAVEKHYKGFDAVLLSQCPDLRRNDLALCHLYLLGLNEGEIAALKGKTYSAIKKHHERLKGKLRTEENVEKFVRKLACDILNEIQEV